MNESNAERYEDEFYRVIEFLDNRGVSFRKALPRRPEVPPDSIYPEGHTLAALAAQYGIERAEKDALR
jgi:hypothetical protein